MPSQLTELLTSLGVDPDPARLSRRPRTTAGDYLVLPSPARPQLLVPCVPAAGIMIKERRARGLRAKVTKSAVAAGLSSGLTGRLPLLRLNLGDSGFGELLTWITAEADDHEAPFSAGILVGPPRANRKPVLRIFTATGRTWGYAKVGINDLTNALVRREAEALGEVSQWPLMTLRAPTILKADVFAGNQVLATSPLATASANRQPTALPVEPTRELFRLHAQHDVPLRQAPAMVRSVAIDTPAAAQVEALADRLLAAIGDELIPLGASHGDWTPWNMAWAGSGASAILEAWDWERAMLGVPQGHDVVHFEASKVRVDDPGNAEAELLANLPARLAACGIDPQLSRSLLTSYLVTIARRYAADLALEQVAPLARRLDWVTDLLTREVAQLELNRTVGGKQ